MKQIKVIEADGTTRVLDHNPDFKEMQAIVGGYIEHVKVMDRVDDLGRPICTSMFINEEGLIKKLPRNEIATAIYQRLTRHQFPDADNPFQAADEAFRQQYSRMTFIDTRDDDYKTDPFISGTAIVYEGYTVEEVNDL